MKILQLHKTLLIVKISQYSMSVKMHHNSRRLSLEITNVLVKIHKASGRI